jgi:hypothetical protein
MRKATPRDVGDVVEGVAVVVEGVGEHKEHNVHDKERKQVSAAESHRRNLPKFRWPGAVSERVFAPEPPQEPFSGRPVLVPDP